MRAALTSKGLRRARAAEARALLEEIRREDREERRRAESIARTERRLAFCRETRSGFGIAP